MMRQMLGRQPRGDRSRPRRRGAVLRQLRRDARDVRAHEGRPRRRAGRGLLADLPHARVPPHDPITGLHVRRPALGDRTNPRPHRRSRHVLLGRGGVSSPTASSNSGELAVLPNHEHVITSRRRRRDDRLPRATRRVIGKLRSVGSRRLIRYSCHGARVPDRGEWFYVVWWCRADRSCLGGCPHEGSSWAPRRAARAFAAQTYSGPWELIVVDNGSSGDRTPEVVEAFAGRIPVRLVIAAERSGASFARNAGRGGGARGLPPVRR